MLGRPGSIAERMSVPAPQVYVSRTAEEMIPRAVLHRARSPTDDFDRADMLMQLPGKIPGLSMVRINGLQVIGPAREDNSNGIGKISAVRQMQTQYGLQKNVAAALYTTFGDAAVEMAGEVRNYMIMPTPNGSRMEQELFQARKIHTRQGLAELAKKHNITIGAEGLEMMMLTSGLSFHQLNEAVETFEKAAYIADAYGVGMQTASLAMDMAAAKGLKSIEDFAAHDMTLYVEAASAAEEGRVIGVRNNNWFPISGRRRNSLSEAETAEAAQRLGIGYESHSDPVINEIRYTGGGAKLEEAIDGCPFDVDAFLEQ